MDENKEETEATVSLAQPDYIKLARHLITEEAYEKSFEFYIMAFKRNPELLDSLAMEFQSLLLKLCDKLTSTYYNNIELLYINLCRTGDMFSHNPDILNIIGKYMYKITYYHPAWKYFEIVLTINPNHVNAEKNLNSIKNMFVERWHFRMLNDHIRNEYYRRALRETVKADQHILDVGTGTGLLAIYAQEAGAIVTACDGSKVMTQMAKKIFELNKLHNIELLTTMSTSMKITDKNLLNSLLVTEMFDAGLLGEHVLQMLYHAWPALLDPKAKVIPNRAEFFVLAVECDVLNRKYQLRNEVKELLLIPSMHVLMLTSNDDTYDCEDVHLVKNITYLTDSVSVLTVDFNNLKNISETLYREEPYKVELKVNVNGNANLIVGWFNLYLSDKVTITTNPLAENRANAWQQAVFVNKIPKPVKENEIINLDFYSSGGMLRLVTDTEDTVIKVSEEIIRFLNHLDYLKSINNCVDDVCKKLSNVYDISEVTIVDLSPFPYFGFEMLKRGAKSLISCVREDIDIKFITEVFNANHVSVSHLSIIYGKEWDSDIFESEKYHVIFSHYLDICGDIDKHLLDVCMNLKSEHLHENGIFLPHDMTVVAQLVSCHWLDIINKVYDENVSNYKIADVVNKYRVTQNFSIDFSLLRYVPISDPTEVCSYLDGSNIETVSVPVVNDGFANAILCWYNIQLMKDGEKVSTNDPVAFTDGMLFLTNCKLSLEAGKSVSVTQYKDEEGDFMLALEVKK